MAKESKSAMERLKNRLYARGEVGNEIESRSPLSPGTAETPTSWKDSTPPDVKPIEEMKVPVGFEQPAFELPPEPAPKKRHMSFATKFFIGSVFFFLGAIGISALLFFGGINTTSPQNIDVQVVAPSLIDGGKEATLEVIITNRNTTTLNSAQMIIDYPSGARDSKDPTKTLTTQRIALGNIKSGEQVKRTVQAIFYGSEGTQEKFLARLEYTVAGSNSIFIKQGETAFTIGSAPVSLTVDAPAQATAGDQFSIDVTVRSNATTPVDNVAVEAQYPFGFSVASTKPAAGAGGTIWRLGKMGPGDSKVIHITGSIEAADHDERIFKFLVGSNADQTDPHVKIPFLTVPQTLTVEKPFIAGTIALDGKTGDTVTVEAGKSLQGTIEWANNLQEAVSNLELSLTLEGPALDKTSINAPNGFYQSNTNSIVWSSSGDGSLSSVAPGATGSFQFSFATLPPGANGTLITNPTITLTLHVQGTRQGQGGTSNPVASAATMKVTLASALSITSESFHNTGPFENSGPIPPHAETDTTYTITWTIKNSANTVANTIAQTVLPPYVKFVSAQDGSGITYDAASRTVKWALGDVKAGAGFTAPSRQASFQVTLTPSTSQVGKTPDLTGSTQVSGQDRFAQVTVGASAPAPTTHTSDGALDTVVSK
jgi:hypothetical protein